jgi:hypothetical protein
MQLNHVRLNRLAAAVLVASTGAFSVAATPASRPTSPVPIAGGYSRAPVTDPGVIAAARFGVAHLRRPGARLARIDDAERQVVAGTNYRIRVTLTDRSRWDLKVFRPLRGPMVSGRAKRLAPAPRRH